jgi:hypothetical protein
MIMLLLAVLVVSPAFLASRSPNTASFPLFILLLPCSSFNVRLVGDWQYIGRYAGEAFVYRIIIRWSDLTKRRFASPGCHKYFSGM